ncbi:hypothetical protein BDZ88DRAFT_455164 [Geranomyces variabilis]|nr:hypothetical protein BDZ88DRAFT_455164 [Geranomyces variabilis]KAJ3140305.1 hypothetical protein HDU90_008533 [Geranomyces variabilis]
MFTPFETEEGFFASPQSSNHKGRRKLYTAARFACCLKRLCATRFLIFIVTTTTLSSSPARSVTLEKASPKYAPLAMVNAEARFEALQEKTYELVQTPMLPGLPSSNILMQESMCDGDQRIGYASRIK